MSHSARWHLLTTPVSASKAERRGIARAPLPAFPVVAWITVVVIALMVLYPLLRIGTDVFYVDGQLSLRSFGTTLAEPGLLTVLGNTAL